MLEPLIRTGKSGVTRAAAVEALSVLCFVGSEGATDTLHTMSTLWRIIVKGATRLVAEAGSGWAVITFLWVAVCGCGVPSTCCCELLCPPRTTLL